MLTLLTACSDQPATSALRIAVIDGATGEPTPARLELVDERGAAVLPDGTLRVLGDCDGHPATSWDDAAGGILDPASGNEHFYVTGPAEVTLPPGVYRVTAQKGLEYERRSASTPGSTGR